MKIVSAAFVIRLEDDDDAIEATGQIDDVLHHIGFTGPIEVTSIPAEEDPDDIWIQFDPVKE